MGRKCIVSNTKIGKMHRHQKTNQQMQKPINKPTNNIRAGVNGVQRNG